MNNRIDNKKIANFLIWGKITRREKWDQRRLYRRISITQYKYITGHFDTFASQWIYVFPLYYTKSVFVLFRFHLVNSNI